MMLHYRGQVASAIREMNRLEAENARLQDQVNSLSSDLRLHQEANVRGAAAVIRKTEAGQILLECCDRFGFLFEELARNSAVAEERRDDIRRIQFRADVGATLLYGVNLFGEDDNEVIDLTGEETEEEGEDMEE